VPPVDQYDCIVVDECHRGYLLDREMGDAEMRLPRPRRLRLQVPPRARSLRRGEDRPHRHAGAAHDRDLRAAGVPVQLPRGGDRRRASSITSRPHQIVTALARTACTGAPARRWRSTTRRRSTIDTVTLPDEVNLEIDSFNKRVVTENFNRVVCAELARHIDPSLPGKTLIFCATDAHADMVVRLLKEAWPRSTARSRTPRCSRSPAPPTSRSSSSAASRTSATPAIAVTVDLLTTGIDVPPSQHRVPAPGPEPHPLRADAGPRHAPAATTSARRSSASSTRSTCTPRSSRSPA
jgi:type I restriction enzyme R subunit